jgi:hypothetical protein
VNLTITINQVLTGKQIRNPTQLDALMQQVADNARSKSDVYTSCVSPVFSAIHFTVIVVAVGVDLCDDLSTLVLQSASRKGMLTGDYVHNAMRINKIKKQQQLIFRKTQFTLQKQYPTISHHNKCI